ncbi:integrin beta-7-like, partial [Pezoporus wallicus]|uniref:integrin beta-7-like n=1 Tax=Pezoporus wallicus TaxID=35540 RepID=UPI00254FFAD2
MRPRLPPSSPPVPITVAMGRAGGLLLLPLLLVVPGGAGAERCELLASCDECVRMHPRCAWCEQPGFLPRCAPPEVLEGAGCPPEAVVLPRGSLRVLQDLELLPGGEQVPLRPQRVRMWLLPGEEQSFQVRFRRPEGHPVDLYYLMDLSYSMRDDLETIRGLGSDLMDTLRNFSSSVRIGLGSFVEKPVLPFSSAGPRAGPCPRRGDPCEPTAAFRHELALSDRAGAFTERVRGLRSAANLDAPESGFDAVLQAAVCGHRLGWGSPTRLLLFCSDDSWHSAGDGKLGGLPLPSDARCHLDASGRYGAQHRHDYPSVGLLAQVLEAADIQLIFAVTRPVVPLYE